MNKNDKKTEQLKSIFESVENTRYCDYKTQSGEEEISYLRKIRNGFNSIDTNIYSETPYYVRKLRNRDYSSDICIFNHFLFQKDIRKINETVVFECCSLLILKYDDQLLAENILKRFNEIHPSYIKKIAEMINENSKEKTKQRLLEYILFDIIIEDYKEKEIFIKFVLFDYNYECDFTDLMYFLAHIINEEYVNNSILSVDNNRYIERILALLKVAINNPFKPHAYIEETYNNYLLNKNLIFKKNKIYEDLNKKNQEKY